MANKINILILILNLGYVAADICYVRYYSYNYIYYCSGSCSGGYYGYQYCDYGSLTVAAIAGIVIGSLIFLGVVIAIIVAICCSCMKTSGNRGTVVQPVSTTGVAVVHTGQMYNSAQPTAPPYGYTTTTYGSAYPQNPQVIPPPPPAYSVYNAGNQQPAYPPPSNTPYPAPANSQPDDHVQQPPMSTTRDPLSAFSGPNANLRKN